MPDPIVSSSDSELQPRVEEALASQYEVVREIGRGGMGVVYLGRDRRLKRPVAIKLLPPELGFRAEIRTRFLKEAETAAQLSHPNIVPIFSVDERNGLVYFVMGFVDGQNLGQLLHERGRMSPESTRRILRDVADGLAYAHARGVIHRDIKPDNILICEEDGRVMVTDFGIARAITEGSDARLTATGMAIGTPAYMSPEQSAGERQIDGRSDLYSLGVLGYQMLVGEPPFVANSTPALLVKHISETPTPVRERVPGVPEDLSSIVMRLLEKDPNRRFPDAAAVVHALDAHEVQAGLSVAPVASRGLMSGGAALPATSSAAATPELHGPTAEELRRWNAPEVVKYRRRVVFYAAVNAVFVVLAILGGNDLLGVTTIWTVLMAYWYAKLWTDGYDWRDVFKQPRDRLFVDVAAETLDDARAIFDKDKREALRERERARRLAAQSSAGSLRSDELITSAVLGTALESRVREAVADCDEITRRWHQLPAGDRQRLPDFADTAKQLAAKASALATQVAELERSADPELVERIEAEIATLEAQANPHEAGSEARIRRLAFLKRQRRAAVDAAQRLTQSRERLDSCLLALQNLRFDLARLDASAQSYQQVTTLVQRAQRLADDLDGMVAAEAEVNRRASHASVRAADSV